MYVSKVPVYGNVLDTSIRSHARACPDPVHAIESIYHLRENLEIEAKTKVKLILMHRQKK